MHELLKHKAGLVLIVINSASVVCLEAGPKTDLRELKLQNLEKFHDPVIGRSACNNSSTPDKYLLQ
jgi:hypothetical protein